MEDSPVNRSAYTTTYSYENPKKGGSKRTVRFIALGLILFGIGLFGINMAFGLLGGQEEEVVSITPTPTEFVFPTDPPTPTDIPTPSSTPSATPKVAPKNTKSGLSVEVQNGSGVVGAGSKMADFLKDLGYAVGTIGNADTFEYEGVTILIKPTKSTFLKTLETDLTASYTVSSKSATLSASSSADAVVIVGK